jgi:4-amino-4-deoxy-L-arabinose transferase-like glycosyltransferase
VNRLRTLSRADLAIFALIIVIALAARIIPGARNIDDSFITFRYSRNIIEGHGFVYNLDSRVMGTTTPLFTLIMAGIGAILNGRDFPNYAIAVSATADAITACLLYLLAKRLTGNRLPGVILGVLWALAPQSVTFAIGGMETSINILCMIGACWSACSPRSAS